MRIVCIADTHSWQNNLIVPPGDVLVVAGDLTSGYSSWKYRCNVIQEDELSEFAEWASKQMHGRKIVVAGNHDKVLCGTRGRRILSSVPGLHYLQDSGCEVGGVRFWGFPWIRATAKGDQTFAMLPESINLHYQAVPEGTDVIVCHELPYVGKIRHSGSSLIVHGHNLHLPRVRNVGRDRGGKTTIISANISGCGQVWPPVVVEMEGKDIRTWEPSLAESLAPDVYARIMESVWFRGSYRFDVEQDPGLLLPPWDGDEIQNGQVSG